jgi:HAD superfamily hydrolase (TIGR01509 family)
MMNIPRTIFFDLDNTLVDHNGALRMALAATVQQFPLPFAGVEFEAIAGAFNRINNALWNDYAKGEITPAEFRVRRFEELLRWCDRQQSRQSSPDTSDLDAICEFYIDRYVEGTTPFEGVIEMLDALSEDHLLGVITNGFTNAQKGKLAASGLDRLFPHVIFSEHVGVQKPDPLIFETAVRAADVEPGEVLYVGDNYFHDIFGASLAGLKTIWYNRLDNVTTYEPLRIEPDATVRSIAELADLLGVPLQSNSTQ